MSNEHPLAVFPATFRAHKTVTLTAALIATLVTTLCAVRLRTDPAVYACCYFSAVGSVLGVIDIAIMRLPDIITLPSYPVLLVMLAAATAGGNDEASLQRSIEAAVVLLTAFAVLCLVSDTGLGDLKLAGLVGLVLGYFGWHKVFHGLLLGFTLGACWVAGRRLRGATTRRLPLGPFLVAGALAVLLA